MTALGNEENFADGRFAPFPNLPAASPLKKG